MQTLLRPATREVRSRVFDSARWAGYQPRPDDIIISTYPKCGTTWTQRIVSMLVNGIAEPRPIESPWFDMRLFGPVEAAIGEAEAQPGRRYLKSHLPYEALPVYAGVKFIHTARDGRDSAMSFHNHLIGFKPEMWANFGAVNRADPKFGDDPPRPAEDLAEYFRDWLVDGGAYGDPGASYWDMERSYWAARREPQMLLVHYSDMKSDLAGEIARIAAFLEITLPASVMAEIAEAAKFDTMRAQSQVIAPFTQLAWDKGGDRFFNKGTNGRWKDVLTAEDLARYRERIAAEFTPGLASWLENGRLVAGDPRTSAD
ncbi:MAG TPA: sulfotransferase domain-containing protein [Caulobacteraceae bacterium]|nr:sulfotransferase domain-containing protein [Caulobacteraceae bacterium]